MTSDKIVCSDLGVDLVVEINVGDFPNLGEHRTFENSETHLVSADEVHRINIQQGQDLDSLAEVAAHEAYHVFHSVRHLITAEEEIQAEIFGQLVRRIFNHCKP